MTVVSPTASNLAAVLGRAQTTCAAHDPDAPARAIRRALADARLKAAEVGYVNVRHSGADPALAVRAFERGLGRHSANAILDAGIGTLADAQLRCALAMALRTPFGRARIEAQGGNLIEIAHALESLFPAGWPAAAVALEICADGHNRALAFAARDD